MSSLLLGLSEFEAMARMFMDSVYTMSLGRVLEAQTGRFCKIQLISATANEKELPIVNVPVGRWIGTSSPVQAGMVIPIFFSKWCLEEYFVNRGDKTTGTPMNEFQFDRNSAFAIPIVFDDMMDDEFPEEITFHDKTIFESEVEMKSTLDVDGATTIDNTLEVSSDISSDTKVSAPIGEFDNVQATNGSFSSGASIGGKYFATHEHYGGTESDGTTGGVV